MSFVDGPSLNCHDGHGKSTLFGSEVETLFNQSRWGRRLRKLGLSQVARKVNSRTYRPQA